MKHEFEIGPVTGKGANKTLARENALALAGQALARMRAPFIYTDKGHTLVVWPDLHGYCYHVIWENMQAFSPIGCSMLPEATPRIGAISAGLYCFAQGTYETWDDIPQCVKKHLHGRDYEMLNDWYNAKRNVAA